MNIESFTMALLSGFAFFVGYMITLFVKDEKKLIVFSVGFAFSILLGLAFTDLLPECLESLDNKVIMVICMLCGIGLLKILDLFVPEHSHEGHSKNHLENHMEHIGLISSIALLLHNIIEGTAIYTTGLSDLKLGAIMALGVAFHNIPLGIQISSLIHNKKEKLTLISLLTISSVIGIILLNVFNIEISEMASGVLISITIGMIIYISLFELLCEVKDHFKERVLKLGLITGLLFILVGHLLH